MECFKHRECFKRYVKDYRLDGWAGPTQGRGKFGQISAIGSLNLLLSSMNVLSVRSLMSKFQVFKVQRQSKN